MIKFYICYPKFPFLIPLTVSLTPLLTSFSFIDFLISFKSFFDILSDANGSAIGETNNLDSYYSDIPLFIVKYINYLYSI